MDRGFREVHLVYRSQLREQRFVQVDLHIGSQSLA